jgi:tubulin beta
VQAGQCGYQVGTKFWLVVVCDEHGIGSNVYYCGENDAKLDHVNVPRAVLHNLEPDLIGAVRAKPLGELPRPGNFVNQNAGARNNSANPPCSVAAL